MIQELSGLSLSLSAARDDDGLADEERDTLRAQARAIEQCCRLLTGVLERLAGLGTPPQSAADSGGRELSAGNGE